MVNYLTTLVLQWRQLPRELCLLLYVVGLYLTFLYWGYLQERITTTQYEASTPKHDDSEEYASVGRISWHFPVVLNMFMSMGSMTAAAVVEYIAATSFVTSPDTKKDDDKPSRPSSLFVFWKPALAAALASPIGYESLRYISYPTMVLAKSSKPVPVMVVGYFFYHVRYPRRKYVSIVLVCTGIALFTAIASSSSLPHHDPDADTEHNPSLWYGLLQGLFGIFLVLLNLSMDGYYNNEQDKLFSVLRVTPLEMMKYTNLWQAVYQSVFLVLEWLLALSIGSKTSQLTTAWSMLIECPVLKYDILLFALCASVGQLLIFKLIQDFGSLVWITVSVTRQLFSIVLSVLVFGHSVNQAQWLGVALVFSGLGLDVFYSNSRKPQNNNSGSTPRKAYGSSSNSRSRGSSSGYSDGYKDKLGYTRTIDNDTAGHSAVRYYGTSAATATPSPYSVYSSSTGTSTGMSQQSHSHSQQLTGLKMLSPLSKPSRSSSDDSTTGMYAAAGGRDIENHSTPRRKYD